MATPLERANAQRETYATKCDVLLAQDLLLALGSVVFLLAVARLSTLPVTLPF